VNFNPDQRTINLDEESLVANSASTNTSRSNDPSYDEKINLYPGGQQGHVHSDKCSHGHGHGQRPVEHGGHDEHDGHEHGGHGGHNHRGGKHGHGEHGGGISSSQKRNRMFQDHAWQIRLFTVGMPIQGMIITDFWLIDAIKDNPFEYWSSALFITFSVVMSVISYYNATYTDPWAPQKPVPIFADPRHSSMCKSCDKWKPERTHHCSTCGKCVLKMDHHCPWVVNCVGFRNHRSFLLFSLYMGIGAIIYLWRSIYYLSWAYDNEVLFDHSVLFLVWWAIVTLIITPVALMLSGLGIYHTSLALNNSTTLESMSGAPMKAPCFSDASYLGKYRTINVYDKGMFANFCEFFSHDYLFWWYPRVRPVTETGLSYTSNPAVSPYEVAAKFPKPDDQEPSSFLLKRPTTLAELDAADYMQKSEAYVNGKHLQYGDRIFEFGKREVNTQQ